MPALSIFTASDPHHPYKVLGWPEHVSTTLAELGVRYVQCFPAKPLSRASSDAEVLAAYAAPIGQLLGLEDGLSVQLVRIRQSQSVAAAAHGHCLDEHSHSEAERHLFVAGEALLSLHIGDAVYQLLCGKGDLLVIPAGLRHWLEVGARHDCVMIRISGSKQGEAIELGNDQIAGRFPRLAD